MLTAFLSLYTLIALQSGQPAPARPSLPKSLAAMVDRARNVPPEFGADSLLRIAESDAVADPALKRELIEEAFRMAGAAQEPIKRLGTKSGAGDTRVSFQARAFAQDLDGLSLQSRAVIDMLRWDKLKARDLFARIPPPRIARLACTDSLVYDPSSYYEAMGEIARNAFTPAEIAKEEHVKFLAVFAGRISAPVEVGPMARVLAGVPVSPDQLQMLTTAFAAALKTLSGDDRSFSFTVGKQGSALNEIGALTSAARKKQVSTIALLDAARTYLSNHLTARRCWDTGGPTVAVGIDSPAPAGQPNPVSFFNDQLRREVYPPGTEIAALAGEEIRGNGLDIPSDLPDTQSTETDESRQLAARYRGLLFNEKGAAWTDDQKSQSEWQSKLREFLAALAAWKPSDATGEFFYRKSYLLGSLSTIVPGGPLRELVLEAHLQFLEQNPYQQTRPIEWFLPVNNLLTRVMFDPALASFGEQLRNSRNAVISLYAQLDKLMPRSPAKLMQLM